MITPTLDCSLCVPLLPWQPDRFPAPQLCNASVCRSPGCLAAHARQREHRPGVHRLPAHSRHARGRHVQPAGLPGHAGLVPSHEHGDRHPVPVPRSPAPRGAALSPCGRVLCHPQRTLDCHLPRPPFTCTIIDTESQIRRLCSELQYVRRCLVCWDVKRLTQGPGGAGSGRGGAADPGDPARVPGLEGDGPQSPARHGRRNSPEDEVPDARLWAHALHPRRHSGRRQDRWAASVYCCTRNSGMPFTAREQSVKVGGAGNGGAAGPSRVNDGEGPRRSRFAPQEQRQPQFDASPPRGDANHNAGLLSAR